MLQLKCKMSATEKYRTVIGLEIHAQLASHSKIYCADPVDFGGMPNIRVSPVSLGLPGSLPTLNENCVHLAIKMGLATGSSIAERCHFARKNYFYPDLPKGYQISQFETPICYQGHLEIRLKDGSVQTVGITRIHMEEDAGKSIHDQDLYDTLIDLNRASVGLIEIVSEPDMETAEQAMVYVTEIRKIVRYLGICDGNMEEGSLRCDANISVMPAHLPRALENFGTRAEVKNMNSISNVGRAINYEVQRQIALIEAGGTVARETRSWDPTTGTTLPMRDKESADDYRYFPEPDLQPLVVTEELKQRLRGQMPELPDQLFKRFTTEQGLPIQDATLLTEDKGIADYYIQLSGLTGNYKASSNWINGPVKTWMNDQARHIQDFPLPPAMLAQVVELVESNKLSFTTAKEKLLPKLLETPSKTAIAVATAENLLLQNDPGALAAAIEAALAKHPEEVKTYRGGKAGLLGFFVGQVMRATGGKADPKLINEQVRAALEKASV